MFNYQLLLAWLSHCAFSMIWLGVNLDVHRNAYVYQGGMFFR